MGIGVVVEKGSRKRERQKRQEQARPDESHSFSTNGRDFRDAKR